MQKENILFIDTTNNFCYVALYKATKLVNSFKIKVNKNVTDIIVDCINKLLIKSKIKPEVLTHLYVNVGPGSFTGCKVGVIIAKVWRIVYPKTRIFVCNSLLLQTKTKPAISIIDAKSNKLYLAVYGKSKIDIKPTCINASDLDKYLSKYRKYKIYRDQVGSMYANFKIHCKNFVEVKSLAKLEPLYLKHPVK